MSTSDPTSPASIARLDALRKRAEGQIARVLDTSPTLDASEVRGLIHELSVHQIELEMQNEQLRNTHSALEASRNNYFRLYQEAPVAYLTVSHTGVILDCNPQALALFRVTRESLARRRLHDFVEKEFQPHFMMERDTLVATGLVEPFDIRMHGSSGGPFWVTIHMSLAQELEGQSCIYRLAVTDISERKRMEVAAAHLGAIVTSSELAIFSMDLDGTVSTWNAGAERLFGYQEGYVMGRKPDMLLPPERQGEDVITMSKVIRGEIVACETIRLRRDGTPIPVYLTASPLIEGGRITGVSHIMRDISEQVASRENLSLLLDELRRREQALQDADRRKDEFIATLAHELRNPLAPIRNAAEVLRMTPGLDERGQWCRDVIDRQVGQMAALLEDLLDVSRITRNMIALKMDLVPIGRVIEQAIETTQPLLLARNHRLHLDLLEAGTEIVGDPARLTQVFGNLLNNAAKYTDPNGNIYLTVIRQEDDVLVSIRDSGIGIDPEHQLHIFDLFSQVSSAIERSQGGLGIGLFLVKALVDMHHGKVSGWSEGVGKGSEFTVRLPLQQPGDPLTRHERRARDRQVNEGEQRRILIADDNADEANTLAMLLRMNHFEVAIARDGEQALEIAETLVPEILLLDLGMPRMNGYEVSRQLRAQPWGRDVFIIAYTGWGRPEDRKRSREAGVDVHLSKPVAPSRLLELLASHTANRRT